MDADCRVFLMGDTLFTEAIAQILANAPDIKLVGVAVLPKINQRHIVQLQPDVILVAGTYPPSDTILGQLLSFFPDIPILNTNLQLDYVQLITTQQISPKRTDLLAALHDLSRKKR